MSRKMKIWLSVAASLVVLGGLMFGGGMAMLNWDFTKLSTAKYETNEYEHLGAFRHISITADTADIVFLRAENGETRVVCHEQEQAKHSVSVQDGTLTITVNDTRKWYEHIGINFGSPRITVYLPETEYGILSVEGSTGNVELARGFDFESVDIRVSTGNICAEDISAGNMDLTVSTGAVAVSRANCRGDLKVKVSTGQAKLINVTCGNFTSHGNTGDLSLKNVIASESFSIERTTGDVQFDGCDAARITVKVGTGDVSGSLLTGKTFSAHSNTGRVDIPKHSVGGSCQISSTTGDIRITVE